MSPILSTPAVVLRTVKFQESSRIVTFFTERLGRIAGIVKGARRAPARYGPALQPMSHVSAVIYRRPGREVQTVSQCDLLTHWKRLPEDLDRMTLGLQMVELVAMVTHDEEEHRGLFGLLLRSLELLDGDPFPADPLFVHFRVRLAAELGFAPDFARCASCGRPFDGGGETAVRLDVERGGPLCRACDLPGRRTVALGAAEFRALSLLSLPLAAAGGLPEVRLDSGGGIDRFLQEFLAFHLPGFRRLRSGDVFRSLKLPPGGPAPGGNF